MSKLYYHQESPSATTPMLNIKHVRVAKSRRFFEPYRVKILKCFSSTGFSTGLKTFSLTEAFVRKWNIKSLNWEVFTFFLGRSVYLDLGRYKNSVCSHC